MDDPNYIPQGESHTCACGQCSEEIARLSAAPENGTPVTMMMGVTIATSYWQLYFRDGAEARMVKGFYTGDAEVEPWALMVSMRAEDRTAFEFAPHRCPCGSGTPCLRVIHEPLIIRYAGRSYREHYVEAYRKQGVEI